MALPVLLRLPGFQQLSPSAVQELFTMAVLNQHEVMVQHLVCLPAALALTASEVEVLLQSIMCNDSDSALLLYLWSLPAAKRIPVTAVADLFELAALRCKGIYAHETEVHIQQKLMFLLKQPAMQQLDSVALQRLWGLVKASRRFISVAREMATMLGLHVPQD